MASVITGVAVGAINGVAISVAVGTATARVGSGISVSSVGPAVAVCATSGVGDKDASVSLWIAKAIC